MGRPAIGATILPGSRSDPMRAWMIATVDRVTSLCLPF
jgi:hypothetical protein